MAAIAMPALAAVPRKRRRESPFEDRPLFFNVILLSSRA